MSLMTGEPRTADVIAESPTVTLSVQKSVIRDIFIKNPKVSDMISDVLAKRKITLEQLKSKSKEQTKEVMDFLTLIQLL